MNTSTADHGSATFTDHPDARPLRRSGDEKMLAGVAGGLARYLNADVTLIRVIIAALALLTGAIVPLYIAAWLLIPADGEDQPIAATWIAGRRDRFR
jgi:phage shock protein PspC (stress-responsive transcriptional regulator)